MDFEWQQRLGVVDMLKNYLLPLIPISDKERKRIAYWWIEDNCETNPERIFQIFLTGLGLKYYSFLSLLNRCYKKEIPDEYFYYYNMFMNYFEKELINIIENENDCGQFRFSTTHLHTGVHNEQEFINYRCYKQKVF